MRRHPILIAIAVIALLAARLLFVNLRPEPEPDALTSKPDKGLDPRYQGSAPERIGLRDDVARQDPEPRIRDVRAFDSP